MVTLSLLFTLLVLSCRAQLDSPESPCPDVFQYVNGQLGNWLGLLRIEPVPGELRLHLKVEMYLEAALPTKYLGRLSLADDQDSVVRILIAGRKERIKYDLLFPLSHPLPHINRITVNNGLVCEGPVVTAMVLTMIRLQHTLITTVNSKPGSNILDGFGSILHKQNGGMKPNNSLLNAEQVDLSKLQLETQPQLVPPRPPSFNEPERPTADVCGQRTTPNNLLYGNQTKPGEWPWIAAIFNRTKLNQDFRCSGVLINKRHVVTAGHCVALPDVPEINASQLVVYLGKYQLLQIAESSTQPREVERIFLHSDYGVSRSFDADLAVLQLSLSVEITRYVIPVCMWTQSTDLEPIVGKLGTVVGWGRDVEGNNMSNVPQRAEIPVVSQQKCLQSHRVFSYITSNRTFCAGFRNETGPCNGDSGSGLVMSVQVGSRTRWFLRGVVSISLGIQQTGLCDLSNYVVFTDVAKFQPWLQQFQDDE